MPKKKQKKAQSRMVPHLPFGELIIGDHFVLHPQHRKKKDKCRVMVKINRNSYANTKTAEQITVEDDDRFKLWVALATQPFKKKKGWG
jgi:hypothetical protein